MRLIDLNATLSNLQGKPINEADGTRQATLRYVCMSALVAPCQVAGAEKFWRGSMAERLRDAGSHLALTADELERLRTIVGDAFPQPEIVTAAWRLLDPPAPPVEPQPPSKSQAKILTAKKGGKA